MNVLGNIYLFSLFLPLIQKGVAKKVVTITTGMADIELISAFDIAAAAPYSISKAAMNATYAKFSAQYKQEGILFMGVSPGLVDTGHYEDGTCAATGRNYPGTLANGMRSNPRATGRGGQDGAEVFDIRAWLQGSHYP